MAGIVIFISLSALLQERAYALERYGNWSVNSVDDRFDGRIFFLTEKADSSNISFWITYSERCDKCADRQRYNISFDRIGNFPCPYKLNGRYNQYDNNKNYLNVRLRIDDGPIIEQNYDLTDGGAALNYDWNIESVYPSSEIRSFDTLADVFGRNSIKSGRDFDNRYVFPQDKFINKLENGNMLYVRLSDKCKSEDTYFNLNGIQQALGRIFNEEKIR